MAPPSRPAPGWSSHCRSRYPARAHRDARSPMPVPPRRYPPCCGPYRSGAWPISGRSARSRNRSGPDSRSWCLFLCLALAHRQCAQPQRIELDEALGVLLVIGALVVLECDQAFAIERIRRLPPHQDGVALVELETHRAGDEFLALVDQGLEHLALGREPEAVIDQLRIARHQIVLQMRRAAIQGD